MAATKTNTVSGRVQVQPKYKRIRAQFGLLYLNSEMACKILKLLGEGKSQSEVTIKVGKPKQTINYYAQKFLKDKLTTVTANSKPIIYGLTHFGQKVLTTSDIGSPKPYSFESYARKFRLEQNNFKRDCSTCREEGCELRKEGITDLCGVLWKKLGEPNNWQKYGLKYCGVSVELNLGKVPTVIIRTGQIYGTNPYEIVSRCTEIIEFVKAKLYDRGIVLSEEGELVNNPNFHEYSKEAEEIFRKHGAITTAYNQLDNSGNIEPHRETDFLGAINWIDEAQNVKQTLRAVCQLKADNSSRFDILQDKLESLEARLADKSLGTEELKKLVLTLANSNIDLDKRVTILMELLLGTMQQKQPKEEENNLPTSDGYSQLSRMYE